ncbi:MAG: hypothetical protein RLZZ324_1272 [Candidatus Parcubacteria bacterium]|jgi:protein-export membrane protein SecD
MSVIKKVGSFLGSLVVPKTPRGKVRQAVFLVLVLLVIAGNLSHSAYWDKSADKVNGALTAAHAPQWLHVPHFWNPPYRLGLDLQGGAHLVYVADMKDVPGDQRADAMSGVRDVIERRVNAFGVAEPIVQVNRSGDAWRLIVDLAGVKDISQAIKLIGETPILEFKEQGDAVQAVTALTPAQKKEMDAFNAAAKTKSDAALSAALKTGADFGALAKQYSDDAATKDKGGDLGFVAADGPYAQIVDKIEAVKLQPGRVLWQTMTTAEGINVVKFDEKKEGEAQVSASHILIAYKGADRSTATRTKEEALALAGKVKAEVTSSNFGVEAAKYSDDASNKDKGGDLGYFSKATMVAPFSDAAYALKKGEVSGVVETSFGYHIIYKTGEKQTFTYHLERILSKTKTDADYLPPAEPWKNTQLSGKDLKRAVLQFDQKSGAPNVGIEFNENGTKLFGEISQRNIGKPVAIYLDGQPLSIPTVQEAILDGRANISGNFSLQDAKDLVKRLNAGALPVPISLETQQTVGASLGQDSLNSSLKAALIGFMLVALFMLLYYRLPGLIAIFALTLYTGINLALFKLIPVTLSLSGIAGFILSVGMAVDANVLIFERMKEELLNGRPVGSAIDEGFKRAWNSIRDSNFTTLLSCTILFYTSSSLIKGFAFTLAMGVLVSMFSAITVSRTLLRLVAGWGWLKSTWLYLPGLNVPAAQKVDAPRA